MIVSCHSDCSPDLSCAALPFGIPELSYETVGYSCGDHHGDPQREPGVNRFPSGGRRKRPAAIR